jgi:hypothetical protein
VTVRVVPAGTDDRDVRLHLLDERIRGRGTAAVVSDLEHVQRSSAGCDARCEELRIDLFLDVAGQQKASITVVQIQNQRDIRQVVYSTN